MENELFKVIMKKLQILIELDF